MNSTTTDLYVGSKKISLLMLAATALVCSRAVFFFFNDPEGPNLLIVTALAMVLYCVSVAAYLFGPTKVKGVGRLLAAIGIQALLGAGLYFFMK